ncbi:sensor histidine kinase [Algihabitans albus]|uniref:sensor histidine kinase n=1 Tax=Algihabitans albus TaxID=2164067 RepID=UPI000E5D94A4|nr:histidine kinase [Algihabitans albus]
MTDQGLPLTHLPATRGAAAGDRQRHISLRALAIVLVAGVSLLLCIVVSSILVLNARIATNKEITGAFRLAQTYVGARMELLSSANDPMGEASKLAGEVDRVNHVAAMLLLYPGSERADPPSQSEPDRTDAPEAPDWFVGLIEADRFSVDFPVVKDAATPDAIRLGAIRLTSDARDEIAEVWVDFRIILPAILAAGAISLTISLLLVFGILRRIGACTEALKAIRRGDLSARVPSQELPEFAALASGINDLAAHLGAERAENRHLLGRLVTLSESERRRVASDLHDGMGPCFFALNAALHEARNLAALLPNAVTPKQNLEAALSALARHATSLQHQSRAVMSDLRPMLTNDMTLADALADLAVNFLDIAPAARVSLTVSEGCPDSFDELVDLSIYRFAQESVLNAIKHGAANRIAIDMIWSPADMPPGTPLDTPSGLTVTVTDNGSGPHYPDVSPSYGQIGITDRTKALGGTYKRPVRMQEGVVTEIWIPCRSLGGQECRGS